MVGNCGAYVIATTEKIDARIAGNTSCGRADLTALIEYIRKKSHIPETAAAEELYAVGDPPGRVVFCLALITVYMARIQTAELRQTTTKLYTKVWRNLARGMIGMDRMEAIATRYPRVV